ncbi:MAG TPA: hypothetical protein VIQ97_04940, partial [Prevotella sp.]
FEETPIATASGYKYYTFSKSKGYFVPLDNGAKFPYFKAYLRLANSPSSQAKGFRIIFDDEDNVTSIDGIINIDSNSDASYYNLLGQKVDNPTRGIYISNGKKVIVK